MATDDEQPPARDWEHRLAQQVGRNVRWHRQPLRDQQGKILVKQRTIVDLSKRCTELGHPMNRMVISNLENGHRESVSVAEVAVLAAALDVPPITLILPLGREVQVEVLPGKVVSMRSAYHWHVGISSLQPQFDGTPAQEVARQTYDAAADPISYLDQHARALWVAETAHSDSADQLLRKLWELRRSMAIRGHVLPPVPDRIAQALEGIGR